MLLEVKLTDKPVTKAELLKEDDSLDVEVIEKPKVKAKAKKKSDAAD